MSGGKLEICLMRNGEYADAGYATISRPNMYLFYLPSPSQQNKYLIRRWSENSGF